MTRMPGREVIDQMRAEQQFFSTLQQFNYASHEKQINHLIFQASNAAQNIPQFNQWPNNAEQFWNAESMLWKSRIPQEVRNGIMGELSFLNGVNIDLGAGSCCYVPNSIAVDFSEEMLHINIAQQKVKADLEQKIPISDQLCTSATLIFVVNYIKNIEGLFNEVHRILKDNGQIAIVQSAASVHGLHKLHYKNMHGEAELRLLLQYAGFVVESYTKKIAGKELLFFIGQKAIK